MLPKHLTKIICNQRIVNSLVCDRRRIVKAVYNGQVIWEKDLSARLALEKSYVWLMESNSWFDTNKVYTNDTFKVE